MSGQTPEQPRDEIERMRLRIHRISDMQQAMALKLSEHAVQIQQMQDNIEHLRMTAATKDQLQAAVEAIKADAMHNQMMITTQAIGLKGDLTTQIASVKKDIADKVDPIHVYLRKGLGAMVIFVILALMAIVFNQRVPG